MNLLHARIEAAQLHVAGMQFAAPVGSGPDGDVVLGIRPGALKIASHGIAARVELIENMGDSAIVDCTIGDVPIKWRVEGVPTVHEGDVVHLTAAPEALHVFDATTGQRR